jgi:putative pyruvate formate lyase activating enzyme
MHSRSHHFSSKSMPGYVRLYHEGELAERTRQALAALAACELCPRKCKVNRLQGQRGRCATGRWAEVASAGTHFGEERPLVGSGGSGTIFFSHCNLLCAFCQNYDISHLGHGEVFTPQRLAESMLDLQLQSAHNINLVTPSHVVPQILEALGLAAGQGLHLPLVYNTSAYDSVETLQLLEGVVDIYMPDLKFSDAGIGERYCGVNDYPQKAKQAVREMHRQVGDFKLNKQGIAIRGLLVRHLILPEGRAGTKDWMEYLVREISPETFVNLMDQYYPAGCVRTLPELGRRITREEYEAARRIALAAGMQRV